MYFYVLCTHKMAVSHKTGLCVQAKSLKDAIVVARQTIGEFGVLGTFYQVADRQDAANKHRKLAPGSEFQIVVDQDDRFSIPVQNPDTSVEKESGDVLGSNTPVEKMGGDEKTPEAETTVGLTISEGDT